MNKRKMLLMAVVVLIMLLAAVSVASAQDGSGEVVITYTYVVTTGTPRLSYLTYADECNGLIIANLKQDMLLGEAPGEDSTDANDDAPNLVVGRVLPFEDLPDVCEIPGTVSTQ